MLFKNVFDPKINYSAYNFWINIQNQYLKRYCLNYYNFDQR